VGLRLRRALGLALLLTLVVCVNNCKRPAVVAPAHEEDRRELARKIKNAAEDAGRDQIWIVSPARLFSAKPEAPIEARVGTAVYPTLVALLAREAKKNHLEFALNESRTREGFRTAEVRLSRHGKEVSRWKLREVRRIVHATIIIDDLGQNREAARQLLALPYSLTFSVLPHLRYSVETAEAARRAGREVMLHLPMEAQAGSHVSPGEGEIRVGMSRREVEHILQSDLASVPYAAGANNHMGSLATTDSRLMAELMKSLAAHHLYFVDSRTTAASVALEAARQQGLPALYRSIFLDDTQSTPYTIGQLRHFQRVLEDQEVAVAIGHPYPTTIAALAKFLPELERDGVQLVPASRLLQLPQIARLKPPAYRTAVH
jgi:hypothetical protein